MIYQCGVCGKDIDNIEEVNDCKFCFGCFCDECIDGHEQNCFEKNESN